MSVAHQKELGYDFQRSSHEVTVTAKLSRRRFLASAAVGAGGLALRNAPYAHALDLLDQAQPGPRPITLQAITRTLEIDGKAAIVMGLLQPNGKQGIESVVDSPFRVNLQNKLTSRPRFTGTDCIRPTTKTAFPA